MRPDGPTIEAGEVDLSDQERDRTPVTPADRAIGPSRTAAFRRRVADHMAPPPPQLAVGATCATAVEQMRASTAAGVVVIGADGRPAGILTERDVARRVVFDLPPETPVETVMSAPLATIEADDLLFHGIARMRRDGFRHMPVVDAEGQVVGLLHLHEALSTAAVQLVDQIDRLTHSETLPGLAEVKRAEIEVAEELFADEMPALEIQALLTDLNNDIHARATELCLGAMADEGLGPPPTGFCVLVMGSGGRGESFLNPDQDNGFIIDDYPDADHDRIDGWFNELAGRLTTALDDIGLPLCNGGVMATNPTWRKTISQWRQQMDYWIAKQNPGTLRLADIFFDFKPVFGDASLADVLRDHILLRIHSNTRFLREMYRLDEAYGVGLGLFNRFIVERDVEPHKGKLNLKISGSLPLVESVRIFALREGIADTSTLARISGLRDTSVLDDDEADYLRGAFRHITDLLLRQQLADYRATGRVSNYVHPGNLSERERDMLVDGFKAIRALQRRLRSELTGDLF